MEGEDAPDSKKLVSVEHVCDDVRAAVLLGGGEVSSPHERPQTKPKTVGQLFCALPIFPKETPVAFHGADVLAFCHYYQSH